MSCSLAFLLFNFYLLIFKVNPCRFSIFYCGCKQPKSVHIYWKRMQRYAFFPKPTQFFAKTFNATTKTTMKTADSIVINNHRWHKWTQIVIFISFTNIIAFENNDMKSFDCTGALLCLCWTVRSAKANHFFDSTEMPSARRYYAEPSPSQRRRLADSITNPRQLVEHKKTLQTIP